MEISLGVHRFTHYGASRGTAVNKVFVTQRCHLELIFLTQVLPSKLFYSLSEI